MYGGSPAEVSPLSMTQTTYALQSRPSRPFEHEPLVRTIGTGWAVDPDVSDPVWLWPAVEAVRVHPHSGIVERLFDYVTPVCLR